MRPERLPLRRCRFRLESAHQRRGRPHPRGSGASDRRSPCCDPSRTREAGHRPRFHGSGSRIAATNCSTGFCCRSRRRPKHRFVGLSNRVKSGLACAVFTTSSGFEAATTRPSELAATNATYGARRASMDERNLEMRSSRSSMRTSRINSLAAQFRVFSRSLRISLANTSLPHGQFSPGAVCENLDRAANFREREEGECDAASNKQERGKQNQFDRSERNRFFRCLGRICVSATCRLGFIADAENARRGRTGEPVAPCRRSGVCSKRQAVVDDLSSGATYLGARHIGVWSSLSRRARRRSPANGVDGHETEFAGSSHGRRTTSSL